jgi:uncharacterized membrane-anchored protein YitT (DUF2179 family)
MIKKFHTLTAAIQPQLTLKDLLWIITGALIQALAMRLFLIPARLASGGVSGLSQVINHFTGWPIGLMVFLGNLPLFILGWHYLGGPGFAFRTALAVLSFAVFVDLSMLTLPAGGITDDLILNTLYGGVLSGIGFGLVYRGRGTSGGSDILARILSSWRGIPVSQSYLLTDTLVILAAGFSFGWENALYALVMLYISGIAAETISQGSNIVRTAMIISTQPDAIKEQIFQQLKRGVTILNAQGGFTGVEKSILYCVITRSEVPQLKTLIRESDPEAFLVIEQAHEVRGEGFLALEDM